MDLSTRGYYTFEVAREANKNQIKKVVEELFKVNVLGVKTIMMKAKSRKVGRMRRKVAGKPAKKAIVKLKSGEKIDLFEAGK